MLETYITVTVSKEDLKDSDNVNKLNFMINELIDKLTENEYHFRYTVTNMPRRNLGFRRLSET